VVAAKKLFEGIAAQDKEESGMLAQAWLIKCSQ